jgi:hypothetical protein
LHGTKVSRHLERTPVMASVTSPLFYISAVDYGSTSTGAGSMRLPAAPAPAVAGARLPPSGAPVPAAVSAVTVAKALSVVQTNPVK